MKSIMLIGVIVILIGIGVFYVVNQQTSKPASIPTPTPTLTPGPEPTTLLTPTELKYRLRNEFNDNLTPPCGDPVPSIDSLGQGLKQFSYIAENEEWFQTILRHNNLSATDSLTAEEKLSVVKEYQILSTITLEQVNGKYTFILRSSENKESVPQQDPGPAGSPRLPTSEFIYDGFIALDGKIEITSKKGSLPISCPICLAGNTLIDTLDGKILVIDLKKGMKIWTADSFGRRIPAVIMKSTSVPVPRDHHMIHLVLDDGRELYASPGHPTRDGRIIGELSSGDLIDGASVVSAYRVDYDDTATYDILPSGATRTYWANGILIQSTLFP